VTVLYRPVGDIAEMTGISQERMLTLPIDKAVSLIRELRAEIPRLGRFNLSIVDNNMTVFPIIEFSVLSMGGRRPSDSERVSVLTERIETTFADCEKIQGIMKRYRALETGRSYFDKLWKQVKETSDANEKGQLLQRLVVDLIQTDGNFVIHDRNVRTESEEIDVVVGASTTSPFWLAMPCPLVLIECKNWKDKVSAKEVRDFVGKLLNRPRTLCSLGFMICTSGFTSDAQQELLGHRGKDFVVATITGADLDALMESGKSISLLLQKKLLEASLR